MTLQKLLLKLSQNKDINIRCVAIDGQLVIAITNGYYDTLIETICLDLREKIDDFKFAKYLKYSPPITKKDKSQ